MGFTTRWRSKLHACWCFDGVLSVIPVPSQNIGVLHSLEVCRKERGTEGRRMRYVVQLKGGLTFYFVLAKEPFQIYDCRIHT